MTTLNLGNTMRVVDIDNRPWNDPQRFIEYVASFYEDVEDSVWPIHGLTKHEIAKYCLAYIENTENFEGDTIDREAVRDIILADDEAIRQILLR